MSMIKGRHIPTRYLKNDDIGTFGSFDFHFMTGAPPPVKDYLTLIRPFQHYVWAFTLVSLVAVSTALIFINKMYATFSEHVLRESAFQSIRKQNISIILF